MIEDIGLVYTGEVVAIEAIDNAHSIDSATVNCGVGGIWRGVVRKDEFKIGQLVTVYLPDSLVPPSDEMSFMEKNGWRVKLCRFRGSPSEVVIMPLQTVFYDIGFDCTEILGVKKYNKPIPTGLDGVVVGAFPSFIPMTDEVHYQKSAEFIELLKGKPYYVTEKMDGRSTTAFKYKGKFGVCSRRWELKKDPNNGYWKLAIAQNLEESLPDGLALQWETVTETMRNHGRDFEVLLGFAFSAYDINEQRYLTMKEFVNLCMQIYFPTVPIIEVDDCFCVEGLDKRGEIRYMGQEKEGVVVRSQENLLGHKPISFKVLNLNYKD